MALSVRIFLVERKRAILDETVRYEKYLRERITELRSRKGISEHRLSLELGKSGSYIGSIKAVLLCAERTRCGWR